MLYTLNPLCPNALPPSVQSLVASHDHHLLINVGDYGNGEAERFRRRLAAFAALNPGTHAHTCTADETPKVSYFRFAAAPAFRTWCVGRGLEGVSVDYALPKSECGAPPLDADTTALRMRYSHFG